MQNVAMTTETSHSRRLDRGPGRRGRPVESSPYERLENRSMMTVAALDVPLLEPAPAWSAGWAIGPASMTHVVGNSPYQFVPATPTMSPGTTPQAPSALLPLRTTVPQVSLARGILRITGTAEADSITVTSNGDRVSIDGYPTSLPASAIKRIVIDAGAGNDTVTVDVDGNLAKRVFADGGRGFDTLNTPGFVTLNSAKNFEAWGYTDLLEPPPTQPEPDPMDTLPAPTPAPAPMPSGGNQPAVSGRIVGYWSGYFAYFNNQFPQGSVSRYHMVVTSQTGKKVTFDWYTGDAYQDTNGLPSPPTSMGRFSGTFDGKTFKAKVPMVETAWANLSFRVKTVSDPWGSFTIMDGTIKGSDGGWSDASNSRLEKKNNSPVMPPM